MATDTVEMGVTSPCLVPQCPDGAEIRGLCKRCYYAVRYRVEAGYEDWRSLEARGKILPATTAKKRPRRPKTDRHRGRKVEAWLES